MSAEPTSCYICEKLLAGGTTRDHVVPRQLFNPQELPQNLLTLPTHKACNLGLSLDEEYFRQCIVALAAYRNKLATGIWKGPVQRSLDRRGQVQRHMLAANIQEAARRVPFYDDSGQFLGFGSEVQFDAGRVKRVLEKIVRGLFWYHCRLLIGDVSFTTSFVDPTSADSSEDEFPDLKDQSREICLEGGVLRYSFRLCDDSPSSSIWWLEFYEAPRFVILTLCNAI